MKTSSHPTRQHFIPFPDGCPATSAIALDLSIRHAPCTSSISSLSSFTPPREFNTCNNTSNTETPYLYTYQKSKISRPFKAYPKDPLSMSVNIANTQVLEKDSAESYEEFRKRMLSEVQLTHRDANKNIRRWKHSCVSYIRRGDPNYLEKRRKNNEAAKRSRDSRRAKEDEIAIRAAFLEQENIKLKCEIATLRSEVERLQTQIGLNKMVSSSPQHGNGNNWELSLTNEVDMTIIPSSN